MAQVIKRKGSIKWENRGTDPYELSGDALGWGLNLSTNIKFGKATVFLGSALYGEGVQNYMNDAPVDIGIKNKPETLSHRLKELLCRYWEYQPSLITTGAINSAPLSDIPCKLLDSKKILNVSYT